MKLINKYTNLIILFLSLSSAVFAQEGTLRGTIKDSKTKEDIIELPF